MALLSQFNSLRTRKPILIYSLLFLLTIILLLVILRISLPAIVKSGTISWFKNHDVDATIEDVSFSFTNGHFMLHNLSGKNADNNGFNIGLLELHWEWRPLSRRTLVIDGITLDNFHIDVLQYADGKINIAGLQLPFEQAAKPEEQTTDEASADAFEVNLKHILLNNISACARRFNPAKSVTLDMCASLGELEWIGDIAYTLAEQANGDELPLQINGSLALDSVSATNNLAKNKILDILAIKLDKIEVKTLASISLDGISIKKLSAIDDIGSDHRNDPQSVGFDSLVIDKAALSQMSSISINAITLDKLAAHILVNDNDNGSTVLDYNATLGQLDWEGNIKYTITTPSDSDAIPVSVDGNLELTDFSADNNVLRRSLVDMASLQLNKLKLETLDSIAFGNVTIKQIQAMQRAGDHVPDASHVASFDKFVIDDFTMNKLNQLRINEVTLDGLSANLAIKPDGIFEYEEWVPATDKTDSAEVVAKRVATKPVTDKPEMQYVLGQLKLVSNRSINFADNSLKEPFKIGLSAIDINLTKLDSSKPEQLSMLTLLARFDKNATLKLDAQLNPLAKRPDISGTGVISGLDLRTFSPLTRQYIGHSIRSGQLDSNIILKSDKGILDSKLVLTLNQFELRALNKKEAEELNSSLGFPLNTSLSLLRDKDNRIKLEVPITGDINKPDFNPADALKQATTKAVSTAVLYYYTPYGLVLAGNALFDLATALKFEPVTFTANHYQLTDAHTTELDKLAQLLTERPGVHLSLCGISNKADATVLYPDAVKSAANTESKEIVLNNAQTKALLQLAEYRGNAVKDYLVNNKKIDAARLIVCEPEIQMGASKAVVSVSI